MKVVKKMNITFRIKDKRTGEIITKENINGFQFKDLDYIELHERGGNVYKFPKKNYEIQGVTFNDI